MTEEQAKTKWCPQARVTGMDGPSGNRHVLHADGLNGADRCIASACMAWRASEAERGPAVERRPASSGSRRPEGGDWGYETPGQNPQGGPDWVRYAPAPVDGYCGLAGAPQ